jgi:type IX secretion system PorP/SprF family membrane protein
MKNTQTALYITFLLLIGIIPLKGQDLFLTQFDYAPLMVNPAQTGAFYGSFRLGGAYRDQGFTVTPDRYTTPMFYIDAPIVKGFREKDWVGVGGYFIQDVAGAGQLSTGEFQFSGAYHLSLSNKEFRYIVLGLQGGTYQRRFRMSQNLRFEDGITQGGVSMDESLASNMGQSRISAAVGLMFRSQNDNGEEFRIGARVGRFFGHDYSISSRGGQVQIPLHIIAHSSYDIGVARGITVTPQVIYRSMERSSELAFQIRSDIVINREDEFSLQPGIGYRTGDAVQLLLGGQLKQLKASLAFDLTTSSLSQANNSAGAIELAVGWIIRINKEPEVDRRLFCPRF